MGRLSCALSTQASAEQVPGEPNRVWPCPLDLEVREHDVHGEGPPLGVVEELLERSRVIDPLVDDVGQGQQVRVRGVGCVGREAAQ